MPRLTLQGPTAPMATSMPGLAHNTTQSNDWLTSIQQIVQQQQTPIWNTLSLQMQQNRQMQESILSLPQLLVQSQNKFLQQAASTTQAAAPAAPPVQPHQENPVVNEHSYDNDEDYEDISEDEYTAVSHSANAEADFDEYSDYSEAAKPLTLVERLEKLYIRLPNLAPPPKPEQQVLPSVRDNPEIAGRIRSLPAPPIILDTFQRFRAAYRKQDGQSPVLDDITGEILRMEDDSDISNKRKALTQPTKKGNLQFQVHGASHPPCAKLDTDFNKLFPDYSAKLFRLSYAQMNMIQMASSYTLDACCHLDALLLGVRRCIESTQQKLGEYDYDSDEEFETIMSDLQEAQEYLQSLSFAEDFIIKKNVWIFASLSAFMRESMLATVKGLDPEITAQLKLIPFNSGRLYNK